MEIVSQVGSKLAAALPSDWDMKDSLTLGDADGRVSVIFSSAPVDDEAMTTQAFAIQHEAELRSDLAEYKVLAEGEARVFGGHAGFRRRFTWRTEVTEVSQTQILRVHRGRSYVATATTLLSDFDEMGPLLEEVLLGLRIAEPAEPSAPPEPVGRSDLPELPAPPQPTASLRSSVGARALRALRALRPSA